MAPSPPPIRPLAPERYKVQLTISRETHEKLRRVQAAGGAATTANIQLRCRAHNGYEASLFPGSDAPGCVREARSPYEGVHTGSKPLLTVVTSIRGGPGTQWQQPRLAAGYGDRRALPHTMVNPHDRATSSTAAG
jgi:hypothetical protein